MMALLPGNQHVPEQTTVRISVQGKHSNTSKGNEVWLTEWQLDGENQSLGTVIENKPGWRMIYDRAFAATANDLIWTGKVKNKIELKFLKHPWSGLVKVSINEFNEEIDLYSEQDSEYIISLPIKGGGHNNKCCAMVCIVYMRIYICCLLAGIFASCSFSGVGYVLYSFSFFGCCSL
ncbi:hypothetical protein [Cohnella rhizosphaerae]|uniref:Uncharacterized protein n=1 Tax=Cohnella rhizosphaerae TaxID=1457232 RepID=A0A9X4KW43_9BACL|nr:hypothetical protein [Cohnella rhizosphaerae]MDG0811818.1 hypothetical protein [Cohnella rhizosphaerae]